MRIILFTILFPLIAYNIVSCHNERNTYKNSKKSGFVEIPDGIVTVLSLPVEQKYEPEYQKKFFRTKIKDYIIVYLNVDNSGSVSKAEILKGKYSSLNRSVLEAIKKWKYRPYSINNKLKTVQFLEIFHFPPNREGKDVLKSMNEFDDIRLPNIIRKVKPKYPKEAKLKNPQDIIELEVEHDLYGKVTSARIIEGKYEILNNSALNAIKKWIHEPLIISNIPRKVKYRVIVYFKGKNISYGETKILFKLDYLVACH